MQPIDNVQDSVQMYYPYHASIYQVRWYDYRGTVLPLTHNQLCDYLGYRTLLKLKRE